MVSEGFRDFERKENTNETKANQYAQLAGGRRSSRPSRPGLQRLGLRLNLHLRRVCDGGGARRQVLTVHPTL